MHPDAGNGLQIRQETLLSCDVKQGKGLWLNEMELNKTKEPKSEMRWEYHEITWQVVTKTSPIRFSG